MWDAPIAMFVLGLVNAGHCAGMCGGIISALSLQSPEDRSNLILYLGYNSGRLIAYTVMGALVGSLSGAVLLLSDVFPIQTVLRACSNVMLVVLGLYLIGFPRVLEPIERAGRVVWRYIQPLTKLFLPVTNLRRALVLGGLWGFIPCGLVYSVLVTALSSGSAARGAVALFAFGLGTIPSLLLASMFLRPLRGFQNSRWLKPISGVLIMGLGLMGIMHLGHATS